MRLLTPLCCFPHIRNCCVFCTDICVECVENKIIWWQTDDINIKILAIEGKSWFWLQNNDFAYVNYIDIPYVWKRTSVFLRVSWGLTSSYVAAYVEFQGNNFSVANLSLYFVCPIKFIHLKEILNINVAGKKDKITCVWKCFNSHNTNVCIQMYKYWTMYWLFYFWTILV